MTVIHHTQEMIPVTTAPAAANPAPYVWAGVRVTMGFVFLWSFLDKLLGLGFATDREAAWIEGGSPTAGFLQFGTQGPFKDFYASMAGEAWADWLYMVGALGLGIALTLGIGMRIAAVAGTALMLMLFTATLQPEFNPIVDEHIVYALVLIGLAVVRAGDTVGLGKAWKRTRAVRRFPGLV